MRTSPSFPRLPLAFTAVALTACGTATGAPEPPAPEPMTIEEPSAPLRESWEVASIETIVDVDEVEAGMIVSARCELYDETGAQVVGPDTRLRFEPEASFVRDEEGNMRATRSGDAQIICESPAVSRVDESPARLRIVPGPIHTIVTEIDGPTVDAGDLLEVHCAAIDAYGNAVATLESSDSMDVLEGAEPSDNAPTEQLIDSVQLAVDPIAEGTRIEGGHVYFERVGRYTVGCDANGAALIEPAIVDVHPGLPASLVMTLAPEREVYLLDQVVPIETRVTDIFGNAVPDAAVNMAAFPEGEEFATHRFRFAEEGEHTVLGGIDGKTYNNRWVLGHVMLNVDSEGPSIECAPPFNGGMIFRGPTSNVALSGNVSDVNGVASLRVNGTPTSVQSNGTFSRSIATRFGMNFVEVTALDPYGHESSRVCSFLASQTYLPEEQHLDGTVALELSREAIDDADYSDGLDSVGDVLSAVLNSTGLPNELHHSLLAANPLQPMSCYAPGLVGDCWGWWGLTYNNLRFNGPHTSSLTPVEDGLTTHVTLRDLGIDIALNGTFETDGWVYVEDVEAQLTFNIGLAAGRPQITLRSIDLLRVGEIETELSGFVGFIIDLIDGLIQSQLRGIVRDALSGFIEDNFNEILDGLFSSLNIESLGTEFSIPNLSGGESEIGFGIRLSHLGADPSGFGFGIGTRFSAPPAHARPSIGVPIEPGAVFQVPSLQSPNTVGATVHVGLLNQALHALWRSGFFDVSLSGDDFGDALESVTVDLGSRLPPVIRNHPDSGLSVMLGGLDVTVDYPELFEAPLAVQLGAVIDADVALQTAGGQHRLVFSNLEIAEFHLSTGDISLPASTRGHLEDLMEELLTHVALAALQDSIPAIPIPSFRLPQSVTPFGLPGGQRMGLISPSLGIEPRHVELRGRFGLQ